MFGAFKIMNYLRDNNIEPNAVMSLMQYKDMKVADLTPQFLADVGRVFGLEIPMERQDTLLQQVTDLLKTEDVDLIADALSNTLTLDRIREVFQANTTSGNDAEMFVCRHCGGYNLPE